MSETTDLKGKTCVPCRGGMPPLASGEIERLKPQVPLWEVRTREGIDRIERTFAFADFVEAMRFVNRVADLAEREGHHPDLHIHYSKVAVELWTHKIKGLHENDFILAAKVDALATDTGR